MNPNDLQDLLLNEIECWRKVGHPAPMQRFVLRNGHGFTGAPLPEGYRRSTPKQCFYNACRLMDRGLEYYEGYVWSARFPFAIHHAWVQDGYTLIDPTLSEPQKHVYWGVRFDREVVLREQVKSGVYGVLDQGVGINMRLIDEIDPALVATIRAEVYQAKASSALTCR